MHSSANDFSRDAARRIMYSMFTIRLVEEEIVARYGKVGEEQPMRCPVHLSIGQEAAAVGATYHLTTKDRVWSTHRCHAHYLAKGGDITRMAKEIYGKIGGCLDGRGGSMHLMDDSVGMAMSVPIVASSIPLAVGAALANKIDGKKEVTMTFFGDASVEEGVFHESMNYASVAQLPVVFVCENNLFSVYTHLDDRQPKRPLADLARAHGMDVVAMNGNDVFAVAKTFEALVKNAREENKPAFVVLDTYRWREHCGVSFDDHLGYRKKEEFEAWHARDPLRMACESVIRAKHLTQAELDAMQAEIKAAVAKAYDAAEKAPLPTPQMVDKHVYAA